MHGTLRSATARDRRSIRTLKVGIVVWLAFASIGIAALAGNTYITDLQPNVSVTEPDCYTFTIFVDQASGSSATLSLRVEDVDEEDGELDTVSLNGTPLGYLTGTDGQWSTTTFDVSDSIRYGENNIVEICIDPDGGEPSTWVATIDWGQILVDGGAADDAAITSVSADGEWSAIQVETRVEATNGDTYRLEINLLAPGGDNKDIAVDTFTLSAGSTTTRTNTVSLPSEPAGGEAYTVQALLFNDSTGIQQNVLETTWTSSSEPPTDISLSEDHIDENLPTNTLIGVLSATDPDSASHVFALIGGDIASFSLDGDELRSAISFDHEAQDTYVLRIEAEDEDENTFDEWITIAVNDVNEPPIGVADSFHVPEGSSTTIDVLENDSDPDDGDTFELVSVTEPTKGTAVIQPDDTVLYTPDPGACGTDTFAYDIEDAGGERASAIVVTITLINTAPAAVNDTVQTVEDRAVLLDPLANDEDAGGVLRIVSVTPPSHGTAVVEGDRIRYTPDPRYDGTDRFSYTAEDACGATGIAWVDVDVLRVNHPPTANAGNFYQGVVGQPVELSASFSTDSDLGDRLEYRWDLNDDGRFDTAWSSVDTLEIVFDEPYIGRVVLEVRDLYRGRPTGDVGRDAAFLRVDPVGSVQAFVFEDLDGDGSPSGDEPGVPGVEIRLNGATAVTSIDGRVTFEVEPGRWTVGLTEASLLSLRGRAYAVITTERVLDLGGGENLVASFPVAKTSTRLKGVIYADTNGNGKFDEEDRLVEGVLVVLDGDEEGGVITTETGAFAFRDVPFGPHEITVVQPLPEDEEDPPSVIIPFTLSRTERAEIAIDWPHDLGPEEGFLQVDVQRGEGGTP